MLDQKRMGKSSHVNGKPTVHLLGQTEKTSSRTNYTSEILLKEHGDYFTRLHVKYSKLWNLLIPCHQCEHDCKYFYHHRPDKENVLPHYLAKVLL